MARARSRAVKEWKNFLERWRLARDGRSAGMAWIRCGTIGWVMDAKMEVQVGDRQEDMQHSLHQLAS